MIDPTLERIIAHFSDDRVDEVLFNGPNRSFAYSSKCSLPLKSPFRDRESMTHWLQDFAWSQGLRLDPMHPFNGGLWNQGEEKYRWHGVLAPIADNGPFFSLRRHRFSRLGLEDFGVDAEQQQQLERALAVGRHILVCGGTSCGKSSFIAALLGRFCIQQRVAIIERHRELPLQSDSWFRLCERTKGVDQQGQITQEDLIREALRLRPDRIVVGEVRQSEAWPCLLAMTSGHGAVLSTIHAGTAKQALARLYALASCCLSDSSLQSIFVDLKLDIIELWESPRRGIKRWVPQMSGKPYVH